MCRQVVEKFAVCKCTYHVHPVDPCPFFRQRGHTVSRKESLVGYTCPKHFNASVKKSQRYQVNPDPWSVSSRQTFTTSSTNIPRDQTESDSLSKATFTSTSVSRQSQRRLSGERADSRVNESVQTSVSTGEPDQVKIFDEAQITTASAVQEEAFPGVPDEVTMLREIQHQHLEGNSNTILLLLRKTFTILYACGKISALQNFLKIGLTDEWLPLSAHDLDKHLQASSLIPTWDQEPRDQFLLYQWMVLGAAYTEQKHLVLPDKMVAPFVDRKQLARGNNGIIYSVFIQSEMEGFSRSSTTSKVSPISLRKEQRIILAHDTNTWQQKLFACKSFVNHDFISTRRAFHKELFTLQKLGRSGCTSHHLVERLISFEQRGEISIIFPWAIHDLRQFYAETTPSRQMARSCLKNLAGLAGGLSYLHSVTWTEDAQEMHIIHRDLKPENILVMADGLEGSWKINDFGLSSFETGSDSPVFQEGIAIGTYHPPESQLMLPLSRSFDIWSFGCIVLECIDFLLEGSNAIEAFADSRLSDPSTPTADFRNDLFFSLQHENSLHLSNVIVRPSVSQLTERLRQDEACSQQLHEILNIVENGMLRPKPWERYSADRLKEEFQKAMHVDSEH